jgi:hypothetical protein
LPGYFFETSALAKFYRRDAGSDFVDRVVSEPGSQHVISRLTNVEMESVFAADQKLCRVATLEGFAVTNPEHPASIVI